MKIYELDFVADAFKEWNKLAADIRDQFARKLKERARQPHVPTAKLRGLPNCYKIKLRAAGYRLVYQVEDDALLVIVIAVGRRERNAVYKIATGRVGN